MFSIFLSENFLISENKQNHTDVIAQEFHLPKLPRNLSWFFNE